MVKKGIIEFTGVFRPFWAFFLTFCYYLIPFSLITTQNMLRVFHGFITMFFFFLGHFSLNAICDKDADRINPRKNGLNSWSLESQLKAHHIFLLSYLFWIICMLLAQFYWILYNSIVIPLLISFAILASHFYSFPSLELKGKAPADLILNQASFGVIAPLYAIENFSGLQLFPLSGLILVLIFCIATLTIVILPTIMMDTSVDALYGYYTFSVKYGLIRTSRIITGFFIIQLITIGMIIKIAFDYQNIVVIIALLLLIWGESASIGLLILNPTEKNAENVAGTLTFGFLGAGIIFLLAHYLIL